MVGVLVVLGVLGVHGSPARGPCLGPWIPCQMPIRLPPIPISGVGHQWWTLQERSQQVGLCPAQTNRGSQSLEARPECGGGDRANRGLQLPIQRRHGAQCHIGIIVHTVASRHRSGGNETAQSDGNAAQAGVRVERLREYEQRWVCTATSYVVFLLFGPLKASKVYIYK